mmetsp:Transcript_17987/g.37855  ORF Transcript_17987/g.37855 Transcript_17987/m.37855 type:complete len:267 (+) Transcript_17987:902-1702(+)
MAAVMAASALALSDGSATARVVEAADNLDLAPNVGVVSMGCCSCSSTGSVSIGIVSTGFASTGFVLTGAGNEVSALETGVASTVSSAATASSLPESSSAASLFDLKRDILFFFSCFSSLSDDPAAVELSSLELLAVASFALDDIIPINRSFFIEIPFILRVLDNDREWLALDDAEVEASSRFADLPDLADLFDLPDLLDGGLAIGNSLTASFSSQLTPSSSSFSSLFSACSSCVFNSFNVFFTCSLALGLLALLADAVNLIIGNEP